MVNKMGARQKQLLKLLRGNRSGMSVDELSKGLEITRNAVRQHLASLQAVGLIATGVTSIWRRPPSATLRSHRAWSGKFSTSIFLACATGAGIGSA